ncbi:MAG: 6-phosphogluconolactonase [Actinobacteria bacterium]|jgi:6-phosphogluconolactonase|uniref:Unannotated protein n=1 Tax=freshwater metagenome TaxID=449393 RepID=A0A6J6DAN9_9ZZZZ|nr:6-phosphogluconolactonase [Actinomycetota bacterium]MTA92624.1 6-phosphogluconolactonase [Actinomycetota bacterium]
MREIKVYDDLDAAAQFSAVALVDKLEQLSISKHSFNIMLTGGSLGIKMLEKASAIPKIHSISLAGLNLWWGDERFVPKEHEDRNALQARRALVDSLMLGPEQIHEFPAADSGFDLNQAALVFSAHYQELSPSFDLVLLGVGPDGHVASLFPGHDSPKTDHPIIAENHSPKPPTERLSFNYSILNKATEVWFLAAGVEKSSVVAEILDDNSASNLPAAKVSGTEKTIWFLDKASTSLRK